MSRLPAFLLAILLTAACGTQVATQAPATNRPTASAAQPVPSAATSVAPPTTRPASISPTTGATAPAASGTSAANACGALLTSADLPTGFPQTDVRSFEPPEPLPGFVRGTQVEFESGLPTRDSFASTVACFDSPENALAQYELWGEIEDGCVEADLSTTDASDIPLPSVIGEQSKGRRCPSSSAGTTQIAASFSIYVLKGSTAFSVSYNSLAFEGVTPDVLFPVVSAATAVAERVAE